MLSSSVRNFADPDDYASSIRASAYQVTVRQRGQFAAALTRIDLHELWMQRFSSNLAWVAHSANVSGRAIFVFRTEPGPELYRGNIAMKAAQIGRLSEAETTYQRATGVTSWASMSLPVHVAVQLGSHVAGCSLNPPAAALMVTPPPDAMQRLLRLHEAAGLLALRAPKILTNSAASQGLEQELTQALIDCLRTGSTAADRAADRRHAVIMRRFHAAVAACGDRPVYLSELCSSIGVADRTLRACCQEYLGIGPLRFLWLRRMQLARRSLVRAGATIETVTDIATLHGFWELGRFAVAYRNMYGESPSATLARSRS